MNFINQNEVETKILTFEPGNCTRYQLTLTKTENEFIMVDLNNHRVAVFNPDFPTFDSIGYSLRKAGYSTGDAKPMAEYILKALTDTAYITYRTNEFGYHYKTVWFPNTEKDFKHNAEMVYQQGYGIEKHGVIWDW